MILNGRNIDGLRAPRIATLTRRRFVAGAACAVACAAAGLLVGCGSASRSAEVAAIEPYVSPYDWSGLVRDGEKLSYYENDALCSRWGIDVSERQGNDIDWAAVADAGVQFAFARIGNRGATEGALSADEFFFQNAVRAGEVGIQVSAYFFSQALTEDEAREEAQFALDNLRETEACRRHLCLRRLRPRARGDRGRPGQQPLQRAADRQRPRVLRGHRRGRLRAHALRKPARPAASRARAARCLSSVVGRVRCGSSHRAARLRHLAVHQRRHAFPASPPTSI